MAAGATFDESDLRRLGGCGTFQRGVQLLADGHVTKLTVDTARVSAIVEGEDAHRVELWGARKELGYKCTCESSSDGSFCSHMVAAGLAALAGTTAPPKPAPPAVSKDDVRKHLLTLGKDKLVDILMLRADWDPQLRDQLFVDTAKGRSKTVLDVVALKETLDRAIETGGGYIDWRFASSYAMAVENAIDALVELYEAGHDAELLDLVEYALRRVEDAAGNVQDDGDMGVVFERLQELHFNICQRARPDPVALAKRLFEWELTSGWGSFHDCLTKYADIFGVEGIAEYKRVAALAWKNVPALGPGQKDVRDVRRLHLSRMMARLAEADGVEAVVDVLKRDLSAPWSFLKIAETYRKFGNHKLALEWAQKGIDAFPKNPDTRLRDFVADEYQHAGRGADAVQLAWSDFIERPRAETYGAMKKRAQENKTWPEWKKKAREHLETLHVAPTRTSGLPKDRTLLVQVSLLDGELDRALSEARAGGCDEATWRQLADALEKTKPADAASIYATHIDGLLEYADNDRYRHAVRELQKIKALFEEAGEANRFVPILEGVKKKHGRKTNLMRMIERARW